MAQGNPREAHTGAGREVFGMEGHTKLRPTSNGERWGTLDSGS